MLYKNQIPLFLARFLKLQYERHDVLPYCASTIISMEYKPVIFFCLLLLSPTGGFCGVRSDSVPVPPASRMLRLTETNSTDSNRAVLNVFMQDDLDEPVLGATALLQRKSPSRVHGRISQWDGRCEFKVSPGSYDLRIQLTGKVTYEQQGIELVAGKQYNLELEMARMRPPVPSAKSQAGKN